MNGLSNLAIWVLAPLALLAGCSDRGEEHGHSHHEHAHAAPHGGCLVMLGEHATQLELVADAASKKVFLYVLDGEAEKFIRIEQVAVATKLGGRPVILRAVGNLATGESAGDTSQFEADADWLVGKDRFSVEIDEIIVRGQTFSELEFEFPEGKH